MRWWQLLPQFLRGSYVTDDGILYGQGESGARRIFVPRTPRSSLVWTYHSGPLGLIQLQREYIRSSAVEALAWHAERPQRLVQGCLPCARRKPTDYRQHLVPNCTPAWRSRVYFTDEQSMRRLH